MVCRHISDFWEEAAFRFRYFCNTILIQYYVNFYSDGISACGQSCLCGLGISREVSL